MNYTNASEQMRDYFQEKEFVFAGLRNCRNSPDYLLYIGEFPDDYKGTLSSIPVIFSQIAVHPRDSAMSMKCNFIPCWSNHEKECSLDFYRGYDSY